MKIKFEATLEEVNKRKKLNNKKEISVDGIEEYKKELRQRLVLMFGLEHGDDLVIIVNP